MALLATLASRAWPALAAAWLLANLIAVIALIQPYVYWVCKRYFRRGRIDIHEAAKVEVGYSNFGPTLGLFGTLRAVHEDQFVRSVELVVTRTTDSLRRRFEWLALRPSSFVVGVPPQTSLELAAGFMLLTSQPFKYNIFFVDPQFQARLAPIVESVKTSWADFVLADLATGRPPAGADLGELYRRFSQTAPHVGAYTDIDRMFDWQPVGYSVQVSVNTANPDRTFRRTLDFSLTGQEIQLLRLNSLTVVKEACGQAVDGEYHFAYPGYSQPARAPEAH